MVFKQYISRILKNLKLNAHIYIAFQSMVEISENNMLYSELYKKDKFLIKNCSYT
jgi:hypothetical protein